MPIVRQTFVRQGDFFAGGLSPGKEKRRSMTENMPRKRCAPNFEMGS